MATPETGKWETAVIHSINEIDALEWNKCVPPDYPFLRHEFLLALENSNCVSNHTGWQPCHILIRIRNSPPTVLGAMPMYLKSHSWGEYIFDWSWADAYHRNGFQYYPKLIVQSPFTPLTSPKLLFAPNATERAQIQQHLAASAVAVLQKMQASSCHLLFITADEANILKNNGFLSRIGTIEFIWRNREYESMEHFLSGLSSKKRKNVRQERNSVAQQGIRIETVSGEEIESHHWHAIEHFYSKTIDKYGSIKYLSPEFFQFAGQQMPENFVLFLAEQNGRYIGGSVCLKGANTLYGRYWGALRDYQALHFEICYYSAIEYCIEHGIASYNAGVQGEHKLSRGFLPELVHSSHMLSSVEFERGIQNYLDREAIQMVHYQKILESRSPYKEVER